MAKRKAEEQTNDSRVSRKQILRERREAKQRRQVQLAAAGIVGVLVLIVLVGVVIEFFIVPNQAVADVNGTEISLGDWQDQVEYQRAQLIISIEEQYDLFFDEEAENLEEAETQALSTVQQFSGQQIALLTTAYDVLGEFVLERMVENELVRQAAAERNITVTEEEIDEAIGERFNYYGGGLPTPRPSATPSPEPTPSITPVGLAVAEDAAAEAAAEAGPLPTSTPPPTATPVSEESFEEQLNEQLNNLSSEGANTDLYREEVEISLYREKLADELFVEQEVATEADHVSARLLTFTTEEAANEALANIEASDFLTVWNTIRSTPPDPESTEPPTSQAREILWRTEDQYGNIFTMGQFPPALFDLEVGETSELIVDAQQGTPTWVIAQVTGREVRELDETTINQLKQETLNGWLEEQQAEGSVEIYENWRSRVPRQPALDLKFTQPVQQQPPAGGGG